MLKPWRQVKEALAELKDSFSELLSRRRTGVIAALLAAAGRLKAAHVDACRSRTRPHSPCAQASVYRRARGLTRMPFAPSLQPPEL